MAEVLRCENCASRDLHRVSDSEYVCNHCKSRILLSPKSVPTGIPAPNRQNRAPQKPQTPLQKVGTVAFILVMIGLLAAVKMWASASRQERRRKAEISRSVSASLNEAFRRNGLHSDGESGQPPQQFGATAIDQEKPISATFNELTPLPDSIGNVYFVGIYKNTGEAAIERPQVELALLDAQKKKLSVGRGFGEPSALLAGEETPIKVLVQQAPSYDSVKYTVTPERVRYGKPKSFKFAIEGARLAPAQFGGYELSGTVRNGDRDAAQHVQIAVLLRDDKNKIVGLDSGFVEQKVLQAGEDCPFRIRLSLVIGKPTHFTVYTTAMIAR